MSFIKLRRKKVLEAACIGAAAVMIPSLLVILYLLLLYPLKLERKRQSNWEKEAVVLYQTNKRIFADKIISEKDLKECLIPKEQAPKGVLPKDKIIGKRSKIALGEQTIVTEELLYQGVVLSDDIRVQYYDYIRLSDKLRKGSQIDIRISYPDGTDFIILSKKEIYDIDSGINEEGNNQVTNNNRVWLEVSEEEILRISSAVVDVLQIDNAYIYAIAYKEDIQKSATANYPVNPAVAKLIEQDPNIVEKAADVAESNLRRIIDRNLEMEKKNNSIGIFSKTEEKNQENSIEEGDEKNNEIIQYLD